MAAVTASAAKFIAYEVVFFTLAVSAVILRFLSLRIRRRAIRAHDVLCIVSLLCLVGYGVDITVGAVERGVGIHTNELTFTKIVTVLKVFLASEFFWSTGVTCFRLSILLLYVEIFQTPKFYRAAMMTIALISVY
ncbi:hypothetical protein EV356DRAFT_518241 [Viridothelium virens]|uniref:Rhodopsin domain-containing protein n=1 Tax=Viridothelium virens TaxID=1048519 RepID=A0A6A6H1X6_VIRVR|nr:hypothetical protein EV356DRAFT_518241 [Viridothelium virens]